MTVVVDRALPLLLALAVLASAAPSHAQDDTPVVAWTAPDTCPSRAVFEAEIERILGRRPAGGPFADITITSRTGRHAAVLLFGPAGPTQRRRRIEGASCEAILRAAALIVALEIDPDALSLDVEEAPEPTPAPEPSFAELEGQVDPSRALRLDPALALASPFAPGVSRTPPEPIVRFLGGAALALDAGAMPDLAAGVWIGAGLRLAGFFEIGLEGRFLPEQRARLAPRPQVGADVSMLAGRIRLGAGFVVLEDRAVAFELAPLIAVELGAVSANAVGLMTPLGSSSLWWAVDVGMELRAFFFDALGVFVRGEAQITLRRAAFFVEGYTTPVFRASDAGFVGLVGVLFRTS
jgi:hypothetical protein